MTERVDRVCAAAEIRPKTGQADEFDAETVRLHNAIVSGMRSSGPLPVINGRQLPIVKDNVMVEQIHAERWPHNTGKATATERRAELSAERTAYLAGVKQPSLTPEEDAATERRLETYDKMVAAVRNIPTASEVRERRARIVAETDAAVAQRMSEILNDAHLDDKTSGTVVGLTPNVVELLKGREYTVQPSATAGTNLRPKPLTVSEASSVEHCVSWGLPGPF